MATTEQAGIITNDDGTVKLFPLETPDEDIAYCLNFLKPILETTFEKLYNLDRPGWGSYVATFYQTISDVMVAAHEESST